MRIVDLASSSASPRSRCLRHLRSSEEYVSAAPPCVRRTIIRCGVRVVEVRLAGADVRRGTAKNSSMGASLTSATVNQGRRERTSGQAVEPEFRRALRAGAYWGVSGRVAAVAAVAMGNAVAARVLSHSALGVYFLCTSLVTLGSSVALLGLDRLVVRWVAEAESRGDRATAAVAARRAVGVYVASALIALLIASGAGAASSSALLDSDALARAMYLVGALLVASSLSCVLAGALRGFHDVRGATLVFDTGPPCLLAVGLLVIWFARGTASLHVVLNSDCRRNDGVCRPWPGLVTSNPDIKLPRSRSTVALGWRIPSARVAPSCSSDLCGRVWRRSTCYTREREAGGDRRAVCRGRALVTDIKPPARDGKPRDPVLCGSVPRLR